MFEKFNFRHSKLYYAKHLEIEKSDTTKVSISENVKDDNHMENKLTDIPAEQESKIIKLIKKR